MEDIIRAKAKRFCELENIPEVNRPKWSNSWIEKFKRRTGLRQRRFYGEAIWLNWLEKFNMEMEKQKRQVILLVDNCSSHLEPEFELKAI